MSLCKWFTLLIISLFLFAVIKSQSQLSFCRLFACQKYPLSLSPGSLSVKTMAQEYIKAWSVIFKLSDLSLWSVNAKGRTGPRVTFFTMFQPSSATRAGYIIAGFMKDYGLHVWETESERWRQRKSDRLQGHSEQKGGEAVVHVLVSRSPNWTEIRDHAFIWPCKWATGQCCYCHARVLEQEA